jgi:hypothetical protein
LLTVDLSQCTHIAVVGVPPLQWTPGLRCQIAIIILIAAAATGVWRIINRDSGFSVIAKKSWQWI